MEEEPACRGRGVNGVGEAPKVHPLLFEIPHQVNQALHAASQTVQLPDHERVPGPGMGEGILESRSVGTGAGHLVVEYPPCPGSLQRGDLEIEVLVLSGDPSVVGSSSAPHHLVLEFLPTISPPGGGQWRKTTPVR